MNTNLISLYVLMAIFGSIVKTNEQSKKLADAINDFGIKLYKDLAKTNDNLICSAFSVNTVLNMLLAGSRTTTETELKNALGYNAIPLSTQESQDSYHQILTQQRNSTGYELNVANSMWLQIGFPILSEFISTIKNVFYAEVKEVDLPSATDEINSWANQQTKGKIPIILDDPLGDDARFFLMNAIYFKGTWVTKFEKDQTKDYPFKYGDNTPDKKILMMNMENELFDGNGLRYGTSSELGAQILELPYQGEEVSMIIVLPNTNDGLQSLESQLTLENLKNVIGGLRREKVILKIPKFNSESTLPLKQVLRNLGINEAFSPQADFSGIDGTRDLYVSSAIQKAVIEVNEEGTVAAAVTGLGGLPSVDSTPRPIYFTADHPFLYFIRHKPTDVILFMGRLNKP